MNLSASSQMKETRRQLGRRGFSVTKTSGGHWRFEHPDMHGPVFASDTPSDHRGIRNLHALLRRKMRSPIT
jgi:predicted RNA binding protein YcfA (HicA-like mRNA interferase family)